MPAVPFPQVDGRHPRPPAPVLALIVGLDGLLPKLARLVRAVLAKVDVNQEIAVVEARLKVVRRLICRPLVDGACTSGHAVLAPSLRVRSDS